LLAGPAHAETARVIDGDTLDVDGQIVHLYGIDAPELGQRCNLPSGGTWPCGEAAARVLNELVAGAQVSCNAKSHAPGQRVTSVCVVAGLDINRQMIRDGFAWAASPTDSDYVDAEGRAREQSIGVWWTPTQSPPEYRKEQWMAALAHSPSGCPIKGSISGAGERVYYAPWAPGYAVAPVARENGERWFCSEDEAIESGWRTPTWHAR
jgi:endonuclease YncB( thermonuclease family)